MQAERGPAGNRCRMGVTVEKAERAGVETSHARRFRNFVGRSLVPKSPVLLSLRNYILLTPPVFALRFHLRRLYWRLTGHKLQAAGQRTRRRERVRCRKGAAVQSRQHQHHQPGTDRTRHRHPSLDPRAEARRAEHARGRPPQRSRAVAARRHTASIPPSLPRSTCSRIRPPCA